MKKIVFLLTCIYIGCGCVPVSNLENNLSQTTIAKSDESVAEAVEEKSDMERSNAIKENILLNMKELKGVAVVVESHTALIGIRPLDKFADEGVILKEAAAVLAKETDSGILVASVTTNEHIISMIEELERQRQG